MFGIKKYTDDALVKAIKYGDREADRAITYLLNRDFGKIKNLVIQRNGSEADAEDVFQEGLTALILNIRRGVYRGESAVSTYLHGICKGIWYKRFLKQVRETDYKKNLTVVEEDHLTPEISLMDEEQKLLLLSLFDQLREKCSEVLLLWANGYAMQEIANKLAYGSAQVVMNKKNKCLNQLQKLMQENGSVQAMVEAL
ncbi:MAG: hypothetical protein DHS20C18_39460 [Saprospiraceae bacterium]|nr:MAG: hypothetical protein DHS20C18_39460 [Saprospiraceae bacterium]